MFGQKKEWFVRTEEGSVYGPATVAMLVEWAKDGRVEPTGFVSKDRISWVPAQLMEELEMKWLVEFELGKVFGPFNRAFVSQLVHNGTVSAETKIYCLHELPIDEDPPPVEKIVEKIVEKPVEVIKEVTKEIKVEVPVEKIVKVPVEKIVEKVVEKPVEVIKEVIKEVKVEVPVEKIVEKVVEKPVEVIKEVVKEVKVEVPVEKIVEKIVKVPVEKIVEVPVEVIKEVKVEVPVVEPPRTAMVVPEVVEPIDKTPPRISPGKLFSGASRMNLASLEAAAQRELASMKKHGGGFRFFGGKN